MLDLNTVTEVLSLPLVPKGGSTEPPKKTTFPMELFKWFYTMYIRVIHEKSNFKFLTSSSLILFNLVIKYSMQNFSNFEKSLEGATGVSTFVHKVNGILEIKIFPAIFSHL